MIKKKTKNSQLPKSWDSFTTEMMKAFVPSCPCLVTRSRGTRRQEQGRGGSLDFSGPRRSSLSGDVYADFLSLHQNRVLAYRWSLGLLQTSWSWSEKLTHPGMSPSVCRPCILGRETPTSSIGSAQMLEPPTYASPHQSLCTRHPASAQRHSGSVTVSVACPLGRGSRAWRLGKAFSVEAEGRHADGNRTVGVGLCCC